VYAGSALMQDEPLVAQILAAVVNAVNVPVTLKMRTGWSRDNKNAITIARIAEDCGIQSLAIHGRTRADLYNGDAEYDTIRAVKRAIKIPVVANGDIDTPEKAKYVLDKTGADAIMIGRAAQGRPWIFREISWYLKTDTHMLPPTIDEVAKIATEHLQNLYQFYGEAKGYRIARKHIGWYLAAAPGGEDFRQQMNQLERTDLQLAAVHLFLQKLKSEGRVFFAFGKDLSRLGKAADQLQSAA
jgi:tRNA-dihydrouridine synthase B